MGNQQNAHLVLLLQLVEEVEDLRLDGDIERGCGFVGDEHRGFAGYGHSNHNALSHSAGHSVRIFRDAPVGVGDTDFTEHLLGEVPGL